MKKLCYLPASLALVSSCLLMTACADRDIQETRMTALKNRQDRIDARTAGRQQRWSERAAREDARAEARFNSW